MSEPRRDARNRVLYDKVCALCSAPFTAIPKAKYCSPTCRRKDFYNQTKAKSAIDAARWNRENKAKRAETVRKYSQSDNGKASRLRYKQGRRAAHRNARVAWRNQPIIDAMYEEAKLAGMTVDHIFPLRSPLVCGLHCEANLMIVSFKANQKKNNRIRIAA